MGVDHAGLELLMASSHRMIHGIHVGRVLNSKPSTEAFAKMSCQNLAQAILL